MDHEYSDSNYNNLERIVDDWVFLFFLVGNDFLPHIPGLDIRAGGIDCLMFIYKNIKETNGYLTENKNINLSTFVIKKL